LCPCSNKQLNVVNVATVRRQSDQRRFTRGRIAVVDLVAGGAGAEVARAAQLERGCFLLRAARGRHPHDVLQHPLQLAVGNKQAAVLYFLEAERVICFPKLRKA